MPNFRYHSQSNSLLPSQLVEQLGQCCTVRICTYTHTLEMSAYEGERKK